MFVIKQNDTLPFLIAKLLDYNGNPVNLELCGVHFHMQDGFRQKKINKPATIVDVENGIVKVEWQEGDTDTPGTYKCEFEVNMPDGKVITVPNDGYFLISIVPEIS
jgi:hypothetical protein